MNWSKRSATKGVARKQYRSIKEISRVPVSAQEQKPGARLQPKCKEQQRITVLNVWGGAPGKRETKL